MPLSGSGRRAAFNNVRLRLNRGLKYEQTGSYPGLYAVGMVAVIVGIDFVFFRNRFWARLTANIGRSSWRFWRFTWRSCGVTLSRGRQWVWKVADMETKQKMAIAGSGLIAEYRWRAPSCWCFRKPFFSSLAIMTRTADSLGGSVRRARISSAGARFPSAKTAFMISRSRRASNAEVALGGGIRATRVAYSDRSRCVNPPVD